MSLKEYKKKRDLRATPEPSGTKRKGSAKPIFVVQRHKATSLHYDFRLEMGGVLKSWAVPKGPSLNPADKRLAIKVEDHPLEYASFEGTIPENNYGAGIVEIWDKGTYEPLEKAPSEDPEKILRAGLYHGSIKFVLNGKKLKGAFALVEMKGDRKQDTWLLIKHKDQFSTDKKYNSEKETNPQSSINKALKKRRETTLDREKEHNKTRYGHFIKPMLAELAEKPFSSPDWIFEVKWDGYRAIAETGKKEIKLYSRNGINFTEKYATITEELRKIDIKAVLDGEVVVLDENGLSDFQRLQDYDNTTDPLCYYVFDLLFYKGEDIRKKPLLERKKLLKQLLKDNILIRYSDHIEKEGVQFFRLAQQKNLEGIMAKRSESLYLSGKRTDNWLKIKSHKSIEAVIGGFTRPRKSRKYFGALILGVFKDKKLHYIGHTGTGFSEKRLKELSEKMQPLTRKSSPFNAKVPVNNPATWIEPVLTCNVKYSSMTEKGILRHPVFSGLRMDKEAEEIQWEDQMNTGPSSEKAPLKLKDMESEKKITVSKRPLKLTHLNKIFWPEEKLTKKDVIDYYNTVSKFILPHLKNRPQSLKRNPNGITDKGFFQKDAGDEVPDWIDSVEIFSESNNKEVDYVLCNDKAALIFLANWGCIEFNPWNSRIKFTDFPDYLIIDIDPSEQNDFDDVVEVAKTVKRVLDNAKAPSYCKTSGATGMHVYVPLGAKHTYEHVRAFAELIASLVHEHLPEITTMERSLKKREKDKVYIDYLQNSRGQTLASAYSLRPRPGAPVSTPLEWKEVKRGLKPERFNIKTTPKRLQKKGDLFRPVLWKKNSIDLKKCLRELDQ